MKKGKDAETRRLRRLLKDPISKTPVVFLDAPSLCQFRDRRLSDGVRASQYDLVLIRHAIEIGRKEWGVALSANPVDQIRVPNGIKSRDRRLEPGEYQKLKEAARSCRNPFVWPAIELAIETAMRRSELLSLTWQDIDFVEGLAELKETKNGSSRAVPLTESALTVLGDLPRRSERVLATSEFALRQAWERLVARTEIKNLRFHDLRHEAVSRLFELGLEVGEVALISGHRDVRMLFRYTHLRPGVVADRLRKLSENWPQRS